MSEENEGICFVGYIPNIKSAFQADGDEVRVTLAIPLMFRAQGLKLAEMFDKQLEVMIKER